MSKKDAAQGSSEPQKGTVHLTLILGIRPGIYLTALYAFILFLLVFFLLFYPGLRNRGSYLTVDVRPGFATIKVDGVFAGAAPSTVFVKNGARRIDVEKPFFTSVSKTINVHGRVFATLLIPSRLHLSVVLSIADLKGLLKNSLEDFSRNPTIPQIVSDATWAAYGKSSFTSDEISSSLYGFIDNCMYFMNPALNIASTTSSTEGQVVEFIRAGTRTASYGTFLSISNFISLVQKTVQLKEKYDNSPAWLLLALSREHTKTLAASSWMIDHFKRYRDSLSRYYNSLSGPAAGGGAATMAGLKFRSIPSGVLVMGKDDDLNALGQSIDLLLPHPVAVQSFYLSETEVTNRHYKLFLDSMPEWRKSNTASLTKEGLVSDKYLSEWTNDNPPAGKDDRPVVSISWNAAVAYCDWLSKSLGSMGMTARLPSESEWEWAARGGLRGMPYPLGAKAGNAVFFANGITGPVAAGSSEPNGYGLRDMMGNVWEWCGSSLGASDYLLSSLDPDRNATDSHPVISDKAVRGGAWNNQKDLIKVYTRGSQPMDWCSPFLGFRVAVSRAVAGK